MFHSELKMHFFFPQLYRLKRFLSSCTCSCFIEIFNYYFKKSVSGRFCSSSRINFRVLQPKTDRERLAGPRTVQKIEFAFTTTTTTTTAVFQTTRATTTTTFQTTTTITTFQTTATKSCDFIRLSKHWISCTQKCWTPIFTVSSCFNQFSLLPLQNNQKIGLKLKFKIENATAKQLFVIILSNYFSTESFR